MPLSAHIRGKANQPSRRALQKPLDRGCPFDFGIGITPRLVVVRITVIRRQPIIGTIKLSDVPCSSASANECGLRHTSCLHDLIEDVEGSADESGYGLTGDEPGLER